MKKLFLLSCFALIFANTVFAQSSNPTKEINKLLDSWHEDAATTDFDAYFGKMTEDAVFIGTDATENWNKKQFMNYSKPYFDRGKAWNFRALERNIFLSQDKKTAWFDELLDTQMKICRGSGVMEKIKGEWKIRHYVLSMTIPNDNADEVIKVKEVLENALIEKLKQ